MSSSAWSQTKHLVIDIETVLIQQVPYKNYQNFSDRNLLFQVTRDKKYLSYAIHFQGREFLSFLLGRDDVILSLTSDQDLATTKSILTAIDRELEARIAGKGGRVLTLENKITGLHDLSQVSADLQRVLYVTHHPGKISASQKSRVLDLGQNYYRYETWESASRAREEASEESKIFFPLDEADWRKETFKLPILANAVKQKKFESDPAILKAKLSVNPEKSISLGRSILDGKTEVNLWRKSKGGKVTGCEVFDNISEKVTSVLELASCLRTLPHTISWVPTKTGTRISACIVRTDAGEVSEELSVETCLSDKVKKFWADQTQNTCAYFTEELQHIAVAPQADCRNQHVLKNPKTEKPQIVTHFLGMEKMNLEEIFSKISPRFFTFREALLDDQRDNVDSSFSKSCLKAVLDVYASGKDFALDMVKDQIHPVEDLKFLSGFKDRVFFHYTNSEEVREVVSRNAPKDFFTYARTLVRRNWWNFFFYVAEDPHSSRSYGSIQVKVHVRAKTKVLVEYGSKNAVEFRRSVMEAIARAYPATKECMYPSLSVDDGGLNLYYLSIEDSGADMTQYWNNSGFHYTPNMNDFKYFQILNPGPIEKIEID